MMPTWEAKQHSAHSGGWYVLESSGKADVVGRVVAAGLSKEDAHRIAALPDMLEALRLMRATMFAKGGPTPKEKQAALTVANAAMTKVGG